MSARKMLVIFYRIMVIGGITGKQDKPTDQVWFMDWKTKEWTQGPSLAHPRSEQDLIVVVHVVVVVVVVLLVLLSWTIELDN